MIGDKLLAISGWVRFRFQLDFSFSIVAFDFPVEAEIGRGTSRGMGQLVLAIDIADRCNSL